MKDLYNTARQLRTTLHKVETSNFSLLDKQKLLDLSRHCGACDVGDSRNSRYLYDLINLRKIGLTRILRVQQNTTLKLF